MTIAVCILLVGYVLLMVYFMIGWKTAVGNNRQNEQSGVKATLTALIPFKDEADNLPQLLRDLSIQEGLVESFKIILIDDHSTDNSIDVVQEFLSQDMNISIVSNTGEGKSAALATGLALAHGEYVVSLDADVRLEASWLLALQEALAAKPDMLILPVRGTSHTGLVSTYSRMDLMSLIGVTFSMAAHDRPVMANGANLAVKRELANWSDDVVSGDDVFLLHELKRQGKEIAYSTRKELFATTDMPNTWSSSLNQRLRWASKSSQYRDSDTLILGWSVLTVNVMIWVLFFTTLFGSSPFWLFLTVLGTKAISDLLFLYPVLRWAEQLRDLKFYPIAFLLNVIQYPVVMVVSSLGGFTWKERTYKS